MYDSLLSRFLILGWLFARKCHHLIIKMKTSEKDVIFRLISKCDLISAVLWWHVPDSEGAEGIWEEHIQQNAQNRQ